MELSGLLQRHVDDRLLAAIRTLRRAAAQADAEPQASSTMILLMLANAAAIEMLGLLVVEQLDLKARRNFSRFWRNYLYPKRPRRDLVQAVYELVRRGITNDLAPRAPRLCTTGDHLAAAGGSLQVNAVQLADDVEQTYRNVILPIANGRSRGKVSAETMESRVRELLVWNRQLYKEQRVLLEELPVAAIVASA